MKVAIIDCGSSKVPYIDQCVKRSGHSADRFELDELNGSIFNKADAIIISGAPRLFTDMSDPSPLLNSAKNLIDSKLPILGICFGHQLIALHFGGKVKRGVEERSWTTINKINDHPIFNGFKNQFEMKQDHCEETDLPEDFMLLAGSENCKVEAMCHRALPIVSVQFHPEVSGNNGQRIIDNFLKSV